MTAAGAAAPPRPARRALGIVALVLAALAVSALSIVAGRWQWGRYETRSHTLSAFEAATVMPVARVSELVPAPLNPADGDTLPPGSEWRTATASGAFVPGSLTVLRNRAIEGARVSEYLAWFETDGGALLVLVGWGPPGAGAEGPRLPAGTVEIEVVLRNQEPDDGKRGDGATRILAAQMPASSRPVLEGYGVLRGECDDGCEAIFGRRVPDPELTLGPHLAYTVQWYALAVLAPLGVAAMLARGRDEPQPKEPGPARGRGAGRARKPARGPTDEEIEDAL
jgi:cytochrome oxidase assembly protein ShyY1